MGVGWRSARCRGVRGRRGGEWKTGTGEREETSRRNKRGTGSAAQRGQPGEQTNTRSETTASRATVVDLGQRYTNGGARLRGGCFRRRKSAMSGQSVEEQKRWRIAQGVLGRVSRESARKKHLVRDLEMTAGSVVSRLIWKGKGNERGRGGGGGRG